MIFLAGGARFKVMPPMITVISVYRYLTILLIVTVGLNWLSVYQVAACSVHASLMKVFSFVCSIMMFISLLHLYQ